MIQVGKTRRFGNLYFGIEQRHSYCCDDVIMYAKGKKKNGIVQMFKKSLKMEDYPESWTHIENELHQTQN